MLGRQGETREPRGSTFACHPGKGRKLTETGAGALATWSSAVGRRETRTEVLERQSLSRYALATDAASEGAPLPHWAFFLPSPSDRDIGLDGHPRRGGFLPDISLPRRMFAGARVEFPAPLRLGEEAELTSTVASVEHKSGRTGDLVFVEVERVLRQNGAICVREFQSFVYRGEGERVRLPERADVEPDGERWLPREVNLFRFSAVTFNGHRIHYDYPYATEVEGYPALVVHGPFTAAKLAALAMRGGALATFAFRALAPLFVGQPVYLRTAGEGGAEAVRCDGVVAMRAEFTRR